MCQYTFVFILTSLTPTPASVWQFLTVLIFSWQKTEWIAQKIPVFFLQLILSNSVGVCSKWLIGIMAWKFFSTSLKGFSCGKCIDIQWVLSKSGKLVLNCILARRLKENERTGKKKGLKLLSFWVAWFLTPGLGFLDRVNTEKLILLYKQNCTVLLHPSCFWSVKEIINWSFRISNHTSDWNIRGGGLLALLNLLRSFPW